MSNLDNIYKKIYSINNLTSQIEEWKDAGEKVVFTNGCFDLIHRGHIELLSQAADLGGKLVIGLNSDISIQKLKGKDRPIIEETSRATLLAAFGFVDAVIFFEEESHKTTLVAGILLFSSLGYDGKILCVYLS